MPAVLSPRQWGFKLFKLALAVPVAVPLCVCPMYKPTDIDRATVAAAYDNIDRGPSEVEFKPSQYVADGATVTLQPDGATYWVLTIAEAQAVGITFDESETVNVNGLDWCVFLT